MKGGQGEGAMGVANPCRIHIADGISFRNGKFYAFFPLIPMIDFCAVVVFSMNPEHGNDIQGRMVEIERLGKTNRAKKLVHDIHGTQKGVDLLPCADHKSAGVGKQCQIFLHLCRTFKILVLIEKYFLKGAPMRKRKLFFFLRKMKIKIFCLRRT